MKYVPNPIPYVADDPLVSYVARELRSISDILRQSIVIQKTHVEPSKPQDGQVEYADGTDWNPGGGVGIYAYVNSAWVKLG